jgi:hypothetical protein
MNVLLVARGAVTSLPDRLFAPLQSPEAVQLVASWLLQLSVAVAFAGTVVGLALKSSAGGGGVEETLMLTDACVVPPVPVQLRPKLVELASGPTDWLPETDLLPVQPPEAMQLVAFWLDQVSVLEPLALTLVGLAASMIVGAATTETVTERDALPPVPVQPSEYVEVAATGPTVSLPVVDLLPLQAPEAVHDVAFDVVHDSTVDPPALTDAGFAPKVIVGAGDPPVTVTVA